MSGKGFEVIPQALRDTQTAFDDAASRWDNLSQKDLPTWRMHDGDLGLLGRLAGVVQDYNGAIDQVIGKAKAGSDGFRQASVNLDKAAKAYEAQDEEYYKQFGWASATINDGGGVYQPKKSGGPTR
jgi:hypothetical protein